MKNAETSPRNREAEPPNEHQLKPLLREGDEIQRVIGAIIVSTQRGRVD
jgi:hypothetical protein